MFEEYTCAAISGRESLQRYGAGGFRGRQEEGLSRMMVYRVRESGQAGEVVLRRTVG